MDIAIIGTGNIAVALAGRRPQDAGRRTQDAGRRTQDAGRRTHAGHTITFGTRNSDDPAAQQLSATLGARITTPEAAVSRGQTVAYAIPGDQVVPTLVSHISRGRHITLAFIENQ